MDFTEAKLGRVFILRLHHGDHLPDVLEKFAANNKVNSAVCLFLGGADDKSRIVVGPREGNINPPEPVTTLLKGVHEACGIGTIFTDEAGKPKLHMHASFGRNKETITGCVRMGVNVWRIGEAIILELTGTPALRAVNKETHFEFLEISKEP
jgi:predicted DNA-binding protein with PD1-like motif